MLRRKSATDLSLQVAAFAEHCRKSGLSLTRQRLAIFEALGSTALLPPMLASWAPNILFGAAGLYLMLTLET